MPLKTRAVRTVWSTPRIFDVSSRLERGWDVNFERARESLYSDHPDARRLLTLNDGESLDFDEIHGVGLDTRRLRIDNCIRLGVFVLLALWPLPWVWINPHGTCAAIHSDEETGDDEP